MKVYNIEPAEREIMQGVIVPVVSLGEHGRGRKIVHVACPKEFGQYLEPGVSKNGKFRLWSSTDSKGWIARIDTEWSYIRDADGYVSVHPDFVGKITVGAMGWGAYGDAGRIGNWDDMIIHTELDEFWVRVRPSRGEAYILMFGKDGVNKLSYADAELLEELDLGNSAENKRGDLVRLTPPDHYR